MLSGRGGRASGVVALARESELEGENFYICFLYYLKVTKQNY
jgi:hypothetical protein